MTVAHLLFAIVTTAYILRRDPVRGARPGRACTARSTTSYRRRVPMLIPGALRRVGPGGRAGLLAA